MQTRPTMPPLTSPGQRRRYAPESERSPKVVGTVNANATLRAERAGF
ncbi:MAG: hypothetical protein QNK18_17935 [Gammaproteobacteria bacterium]|nr:hypothetical protein [Gammaproteobacteria bacterium]